MKCTATLRMPCGNYATGTADSDLAALRDAYRVAIRHYGYDAACDAEIHRAAEATPEAREWAFRSARGAERRRADAARRADVIEILADHVRAPDEGSLGLRMKEVVPGKWRVHLGDGRIAAVDVEDRTARVLPRREAIR